MGSQVPSTLFRGVLLLISLLVTAAGFALWARRGDRRTDLRRCPRCWYDMSGVKGLHCPECGATGTGEASLHHSRRRQGYRISTACVAVLAAATVWGAVPLPWTHKVPTPILGAILDIREWTLRRPGAGVSGIPPATAHFQGSRDPWQRAIWQHELARGLRAWMDTVLANDGPITDAELARLAPLAIDAHALYMAGGSTRATEYWFAEDVTRTLVARRGLARGDQELLLRLEWALAELQYDGQIPGRRETFALLPESLLRRALAHADPAVRLFGVLHFGRRAHLAQLHPEIPLPALEEDVRALCVDPDAKVRAGAAMVIRYIDNFATLERK